VSLLQRIARTFCVLLVLGLASGSGAPLQCAYAQTAGPTQPSAQPAAPPNAAPNSQAAPADPHIDKAQIAQRLNRELDFTLETTTTGWQHALDRVDGELARPHLRYTELNRLRDELQSFAPRLPIAGAKSSRGWTPIAIRSSCSEPRPPRERHRSPSRRLAIAPN
jgi:hypothetical protein